MNMNETEFTLEMAKAAAEGAGKECANKLVAFFEGIFPNVPLKREALETYVSEIKASDMSPEAKMMAIGNAGRTYKQLSNQLKIAAIAHDSAKEGTDFSMTSGVDEEWLNRFMDSAKFVSDEEVQLLWGNVLAGEFEEPNSTPPSVIRILSEITPTYAKAFECLCNLSVVVVGFDKNNTPVFAIEQIIVPKDYDYLEKYGLHFSALSELEMLGLIQFDPVSGYIKLFANEDYPKLLLKYGNKQVEITKYKDKAFPTGCVLLTNAGSSIQRFISTKTIEEHFDAVEKFLKGKGVELEESALTTPAPSTTI